MEREPISSFQLPPGFRFHPSDEELINCYLLNKVNSRSLPASIIGEIELYNYNPWELPRKALFGEDEWYFFTPRDRKYPNGERPNRTAASGYWKATGTDKPILTSGFVKIGVKKALVFYTGRLPKGGKTDWTMNEYRLPATSQPSKLKGSMRLDDWVLCRVRQKGNMSKNTWEVRDSPCKNTIGYFPKMEELPSTQAYSNTNTMTDFGYEGRQILASLLAGQLIPPIYNISSEIFQDKGSSLYDNVSDELNSPLADSFFDIIFNASKGKSNDGTRYDNLFPSTQKVSNNKENDDLPQGNKPNTDNMNFYIQGQPERDIFNPIPSHAMVSLQGLNESSLTGRCPQ
ncbi:NAC transcription factor [Actinidia chinensis var. chinensis]|uniref:NAC transcription factor n=1 Tax=Actinidia chinensis var. chinensis TaxID=1590841 RepID=A0A2R6PF37_ACTCC|nr:NAC transcription factor [Actinidia chinensis var. chinensis]